jgi:sec-independent protein translocase protein TatB
MFDVGYSELLVIAIVMIVVVGPKDLPKMLRAFGKATSKFRQMSGDFKRQFDDALKEAELDDVKKALDSVKKLDPRQQVKDVLNPFKEATSGIRDDLNKAVQPKSVAAPAPVMTETVETKTKPRKAMSSNPAAKKAAPVTEIAPAKVTPAKVTKAKATAVKPATKAEPKTKAPVKAKPAK